jgi:hypothetical protein
LQFLPGSELNLALIDGFFVGKFKEKRVACEGQASTTKSFRLFFLNNDKSLQKEWNNGHEVKL